MVINIPYCLTRIASLSAGKFGRQFSIEKHLTSPSSDFLGEAGTTSAAFRFDVSLFSLESMVERLSSDDCEVAEFVVVVLLFSSDDDASVIFARSLLSESYMCAAKKQEDQSSIRCKSELVTNYKTAKKKGRKQRGKELLVKKVSQQPSYGLKKVVEHDNELR